MGRTLEIYWDFSSPFAYLGSTQAEAVAKRHGATLVWQPMLLGGVFRSIGQADVPLATWSEAKRKYTFEDMHRWAAFWGVPFKFPSNFPMSSVKAMRAYLALPEDRRKDYREKTFRACWAEDRNISDDAVLRECLDSGPRQAGPGADEVLARTQDPAVKKALLDATEHAVKAGVFGAPTWVVDGKELFWGQDRLPLVERELAR
jgi:2-hydroxychromene-2-carboxylate isomerase